MSHGYHLVAKYESGFVLEQGYDDRSPYSPTGSTWDAIVKAEPTAHGHGPLVSLWLMPESKSVKPLFVDFAQLSRLGVNAKPVYFRRMEMRPDSRARCVAHVFGYEHDGGREVKEVGSLNV